MSIAVIQQPGGLGGGSSTTVKGGVTSIPSGATSVTIAFGFTFASAPSVRVTIGRPAGSPLVQANVNTDSITTTGCTVALSVATPDGNYKAEWEASL